jgi:outer membrane scaffolding protein for murein synthesis (MipA/OmpV family)
LPAAAIQPRFRFLPPLLLAGAALALAAPLPAQELGGDALEDTAFDGDWLAVGVGVGVGPSYAGSDDYAVFPFPLVIGRLGGIGISARPSGLALDLLPRQRGDLGFSLGPSLRLRSNRATDPKDPVVARLPQLQRSVDLGPSGGVSFPGILHDYDSLSVSFDALWDVTGTHGGMTVSPSVTYFTPLGKGAAVVLTLDADHGDREFMDYYYSVSPAAAGVSGLSRFEADGGWYRAGAYLVGGIDLNGKLADGGFALFGIAAWSRMLGDAKASPFTSERGSADQFVGAVGVGYTF